MNIAVLRELRDNARRSADPALPFYTTLYGEAAAVGKTKGNRETTDDEVLAVVRKFLAGVQETLGLVGDDRPELRTSLLREQELLLLLLPRQLTDEELASAVNDAAASFSSVRDMGKVMALLKERHGGTFDGAKASALVKKALS